MITRILLVAATLCASACIAEAQAKRPVPLTVDSANGGLILGTAPTPTQFRTANNIMAADVPSLILPQGIEIGPPMTLDNYHGFRVDDDGWVTMRNIPDAAIIFKSETKQMLDLGQVSIDWSQRHLRDPFGITVLNWATQTLLDSGGGNSASWGARQLFSATGVKSADWYTRELYGANGTSVALTWSNNGVAVLAGSAATPSIHFGTSNTGIFGGASSVAITTGGTQRASFSSSGLFMGTSGYSVNFGGTAGVAYSSSGMIKITDGASGLGKLYSSDILVGSNTGTSSAGRFIYVGDSGSAGITLERTSATTGKYSFFTRGTGDFGFYDELNSRYAVNIRKSDGVVEFPIGAAAAGYVSANEANSGARIVMGGWTGGPATYGGMWIGIATPADGNYTLLAGANQTFINAPSGGSINFRIANGQVGAIGGSGMDMGAFTVGSGSYLNILRSATASLDYPSVAANTEATLTLTVTGAVTTNTPNVSLGWSAALPDGVVVKQAWVSAADTVSVRVRNVTGSAIDPTAVTCRATVMGF